MSKVRKTVKWQIKALTQSRRAQMQAIREQMAVQAAFSTRYHGAFEIFIAPASLEFQSSLFLRLVRELREPTMFYGYPRQNLYRLDK
jgi:hypothetical protein